MHPPIARSAAGPRARAPGAVRRRAARDTAHRPVAAGARLRAVGEMRPRSRWCARSSRASRAMRVRATCSPSCSRRRATPRARSPSSVARWRSTPDDVPTLRARAAIYTARGQVRPGRSGPAARREARRPERRRAGAARRAVLQARALARSDRAAARRDRRRSVLRRGALPSRRCVQQHRRAAGRAGAYEAAAQLEPANDRALKRIGVVLDRMGRPAEAAAAYQRARAARRR